MKINLLTPSSSSSSLENLATAVKSDLIAIKNAIGEVQQINFVEWHALPAKFGDGDMYFFAAGVAGAGRGLYIRHSAAWNFIA